MSLVKISEKIKVPPGAGIDGFLKAIKEVLQLRRVQGVHISPTGMITVEHYVPDELDKRPATHIDMTDVTPGYAIQHVAAMHEVAYTFGSNAAEVICRMFGDADCDDLVPFAFVIGTASKLWDWHAKTSRTINRGSFYGLPLIEDPTIPDDILVMCTSYERSSTFAEIINTYKIALVM